MDKGSKVNILKLKIKIYIKNIIFNLPLLACSESAIHSLRVAIKLGDRMEGSLWHFLGGLSLHLNHLITSHVANYNWPFGTLLFGLFGSNLDTRDLETYPRTFSGHF